jgi:hypothetical protein
MTVAAAVAVAWAGSALASVNNTGTLEVCKSSLNGMSGKTFSYTWTANGGTPVGFSVKGGRCTGPMQVTAGNLTILEAQSDPATDVASVRVTPSARLVSQDLTVRKAVVNVPVGSTVANESRVTFVNQPAGGNFGDLKICKLSATPAFIGKNFSFKVNGGSAISVEAGDAYADPASWSCRLAGHFQVGSKVTVQELVPSEAQVDWIDTDPAGALTDLSTTEGYAIVTIGTGMTIAMFDNEPFVPQGNGYIEVCKDRALLDYGQYDWDVHGSFHFTITDQAGAVYQRDVLVGQCSEPIQVAAGIATVTEAPSAYQLVDVWTLPEDRLQTTNLLNGTADVEIPVSDDPNDETQVHFVNKTPRAQLKICKALGGSKIDDLVGTAFYFDVYFDGQMKKLDTLYPFKIVAGTTTQCKIWGDVPVGTDVTVSEDLDYSVGSDAQYIDVTGQDSTITIKPGINTVTITNTPMGQLEICKARIEYANPRALNDNAQPYINFRVDNQSKLIQVRAGRCSMPLRVSLGQHTVTEVSYNKAATTAPYGPTGSAISLSSAASDYELDTGGSTLIAGVTLSYVTPGNGIDVTPGDQLVSKNLTTRTVTVNVRYGAKGETLVTFYNRIRKGRIKICKLIPYTSQDSLGGKTFSFDWRVDGRHGTEYLKPGECTYVLGDSPLIQPDGSPTPVSVQETTPGLNAPGGYSIDSINVQFGRDPIAVNTTTGLATWNLGPDTNVVTYTNRSIDP